MVTNDPRPRARRARAAAVLAAAALVAPASAGAFTGPAGPAPATVWAVGDGAIRTPATRALAAMVAASRPAAFLYLGDVYEYGTRSDFARNYAGVYGPLDGITLPTPGNHDWPQHAAGYDPYWARVTGRATPPYYAVSAAGWRILSLNSETDHSSSSAQVAWLRRQLRAPGTCRLAFWHRPRFSAGLHGDQTDVAPLWNALRGHAVLVLNGHEHDMQRMRIRAGITELVAGAGGRGHYPLNAADPRLAWSDASHDGAVRITLEPGRARFAFVATDGSVLQRGAVRCRPA